METKLTVEDVLNVSPDLNAIVNYIVKDCIHERKMLRNKTELSGLHNKDEIIEELINRGFKIHREQGKVFVSW